MNDLQILASLIIIVAIIISIVLWNKKIKDCFTVNCFLIGIFIFAYGSTFVILGLLFSNGWENNMPPIAITISAILASTAMTRSYLQSQMYFETKIEANYQYIYSLASEIIILLGPKDKLLNIRKNIWTYAEKVHDKLNAPDLLQYLDAEFFLKISTLKEEVTKVVVMLFMADNEDDTPESLEIIKKQIAITHKSAEELIEFLHENANKYQLNNLVENLKKKNT